MGSRTGRGLGVCTGTNAPRNDWGFGAGYGMGNRIRARNGSGLGYRNGRRAGNSGWLRNPPGYTPGYPDDQEYLNEKIASLEAELKAVQQRMSELKKGNVE